MLPRIQEGIYYRSKPSIGDSFCVLSLKADQNLGINQIGFGIGKIWNQLLKLKEGITRDLDVHPNHSKSGSLTILIGYGPRSFELAGSQKLKPSGFSDSWNFKPPNLEGGGSLLEGIDLSYAKQVYDNHLLLDHVVFQFIADSEFYTTRAASTVWKELRKLTETLGIRPFRITGIYTGFQRPDRRNWLGFHDGVSNLKSQERSQVISISARNLNLQERWTLNGTYLTFMRIYIDLEKWDDTPVREQEIIIGRDKITGCPLIGIDDRGHPIKDPRCPVHGTSEVIDSGNEHFRSHPPYWNNTPNRRLQGSHIERNRSADKFPVGDRRSSRIFRQGFEFLEISKYIDGFTVGLNFVSFQNSPERLFKTLTYPSEIPYKNSRPRPFNSLEQFLSVSAAGTFFIPPVVSGEPFPGAQIFFSNSEMRYYADLFQRVDLPKNYLSKIRRKD
jgi:deferrochelatase/peroxidase EfeB